MQEIEAAADDFLTHEAELIASMKKAANGTPLSEWCAEQSRAAYEAMQDSKREAAEELGMAPEAAEAEFASFEADVARCATEAGVDASVYAAAVMEDVDNTMEELGSEARQRGMSIAEYSATLAKIEIDASRKAAALGMTVDQYVAFAWDTVAELRARPNLQGSQLAEKLHWGSSA